MALRFSPLRPLTAVAATLILSTTIGAAAERFVVAIVRDDGKLLPFGLVDEDQWKPAWTPMAKVAEVPIRLADIPGRWLRDVPFSPTWRLVPDTGEPRAVTVTRPVVAAAACRQNVLLESPEAARDPMRPPAGPFVPKQGLATLGGGRVELPTRHDASSPLFTQLGDALTPHFERSEELRLRSYVGLFVHPYRVEQRRAYPVQVVAAYSGPGPDGPVAYFEAVRRYPREAEDAEHAWCDVVSYAAGWTHPSRDGERRAELTITDLEITSCLLETATRRSAMGVVHVGTTPTWVLEERVGTYERIAVYEPPGRRDVRLLLSAPTATCE